MSSAIIMTSPSTPTPTSRHRPRVSPAPTAIQPPPNTPLTPTFATFLLPFAPTLSTSHEHSSFAEDAEGDEELHTLTSYGDLTPTESYHPLSPSPNTTNLNASPLGSPKRYPNGCLRLRSPICKPPMHKRSSPSFSPSASACDSENTHVGYDGQMFGAGNAGNNWCRIVIGGDLTPSPSPTVQTQSPFPFSSKSYLLTPSQSSPSTPPSPLPLPIPLRPLSLASNLNPSRLGLGLDDPITPISPAPLPIPLRSSGMAYSAKSKPHPFGHGLDDPTSDTETVVDPEANSQEFGLGHDGSDTCATDSDSGSGFDSDDADRDHKKVYKRVKPSSSSSMSLHVNANLAGEKTKTRRRAPIPKWRISSEDADDADEEDIDEHVHLQVEA